MEVKVTKLVPRNSTNSLKAFADVEISEGSLQITIYGVKVFNSAEKGDYIGLPANPPKEPMVNGKPAKWFDIIGLNKDTFFKVRDAVLEAYKTGKVSPSSRQPAKAPAGVGQANGNTGFGGSLGQDADEDVAPF